MMKVLDVCYLRRYLIKKFNDLKKWLLVVGGNDFLVSFYYVRLIIFNLIFLIDYKGRRKLWIFIFWFDCLYIGYWL